MSRKQLEMLFGNNRELLDSLLWGSTVAVGYPSVSLASCLLYCIYSVKWSCGFTGVRPAENTCGWWRHYRCRWNCCFGLCLDDDLKGCLQRAIRDAVAASAAASEQSMSSDARSVDCETETTATPACI